ncbi:hypothetical protein NCS52_00616100 [Fusarium sp. LHS14.1]|nr:hypothetical protein NCS52_00616100 [Fusarium sp. LHS14.1]
MRDGFSRGVYYVENNLFFLFMLRVRGFQVYPISTKSRVRIDSLTREDIQGWGHIVQTVTFPDASLCVTDVCFGGDGPTQLMLLREESYIHNLGTQNARFVRDFIPGQASRAPEHRMWKYQCRNRGAQPQRTFYSFSDAVDQLPPDFGVVNCFTTASLDSSAVTSIYMVKFLRRATTNGKDGQATTKGQQQEVFRKRMLMSELVRENLERKTRVVQECQSKGEEVTGFEGVVWS